MGADRALDCLVCSDRLAVLGSLDAPTNRAGQPRQSVSFATRPGLGPGEAAPLRAIPDGEPDFLSDVPAPRPDLLDRLRPRGLEACLPAVAFQPDPAHAGLAAQS